MNLQFALTNFIEIYIYLFIYLFIYYYYYYIIIVLVLFLKRELRGVESVLVWQLIIHPYYYMGKTKVFSL